MEDIHDLKPLMQLDFPWLSFLVFSGLVLGVLLVLFFVLRYLWKRRKPRTKKTVPVPPPKPRVNPREAALKALNKLRPDATAPDAFYEELERILRRFLEGATDEAVTSYTASELSMFFQKRRAHVAFNDLATVLQHGERTKFAGHALTEQLQAQDLSTVTRTVKDFRLEEV